MKKVISSNLVKFETAKAYLIALPKSDVDFWLTKKCCYQKGSDRYSIYVNPKYTYIGRKRDTHARVEIDGADLVLQFDNYNHFYRGKEKPKPEPETVEIIHHTPESKEALTTVTVDSSLLR